jgi:hypothetical protein
MKRARTFFISGVWIAILPYLGVPYFWKNILITLSGLWVASLGYLLYREMKAVVGEPRVFDNFSENEDFSQNQNSDNQSS